MFQFLKQVLLVKWIHFTKLEELSTKADFLRVMDSLEILFIFIDLEAMVSETFHGLLLK